MQKQIIKGYQNEWEIVIGLEIHAQINTESKLFSRSSTQFGGKPNNHTSLIDAAMPGMLPVLNKNCIAQTIKTGLGLNAKINKLSIFDRKNYFYADLPQGYQISQFSNPIIEKGQVEIDLPDGTTKAIRITRIHIEQDAGKSIHDQSPTESFIDLNRSGVPLMEIVTEPDISSSEEAAIFLKKLRSILQYIGSCDGDMENGSLRCDANVSVRKVGSKELGTRTEIKNLNSFRNIVKAINYEAQRQVDLLEAGDNVSQETRLFDTNTNATRTMRSKEDAHDYRYFPDPDLPPVMLNDDYITSAEKELPELPDQKKHRYVNNLGLTSYDASVIIADKQTADFFEQVAAHVNPKLAANWIIVELFGKLNKEGLDLLESKITPQNFCSLIKLVEEQVISGKIAKDVFEIMLETGENADIIVEKHNLKQMSNEDEIIKIIDVIISDNPEKVAEYKNGKEKLFGFFVGQVMKLTQGKANPQKVNKLLEEHLNK